MPLSGDLDVVELGQVFQMLASGRKEGRLVVERPGERRELWFSRAGLALSVDDEEFRDQVLDVLQHLDRIPEEALRAAVRQAVEDGVHPLNTLLSLGLLDPIEVNGVYRRLTAEGIYQLFDWRGARFEFVEEPAPVEGFGGKAPPQFLLHPENVVMEAARRVDEWGEIRRHLPDPRMVFVPVASSEALEREDPSEAEARCLRLVDGFRSVENLAARTGAGAFETQKQVVSLLGKGWIRPLEAEEYSAAATEAFEEGRFAEAAQLYEFAIEAGQDLPDAVGAAGRAREAMQDFLGAGAHYRRYASELAAAGDPAVAVEVLRRSIELLPTDLAAREGLLFLLLESGLEPPQGYHPRAEAKELVSLLLESGNPAASRRLVERSVEKFPQDQELRLAMASAWEREGEVDQAIALYGSMAGELRAAGDGEEAMRLLQKALVLDPERLEIRNSLSALHEEIHRRRQHRRGLRILAGVVGGCALLAVGVGLRERSAREAFQSLGAESHLLRGNFDTAEAEFREFLESYPFTFVAREASEGLDRVAGLRAEAETRAKEKKAAEEQRLAKQVAMAERSLQASEKAAREDRLAEAIGLMKRSLEEAPRDWERRVRVQQEVADLEEYVRKGEDLLREAEEAQKEGRLKEARRQLRMLLDRFPHSPAVERAAIPFQIETSPPGAVASWEGAKLPGRTPLVLRVDPGAKGSLLVEREGFAPQTVAISADGDEDFALILMRVPDRVVPVEGLAATNPAISTNRLYFGLSGGKLAACDLDTGKVLWSFAIQGFGELTTPPLPAGDLVFFGASDLRLYAVNLWGEERWRISVDKAVRGAPLLLKDRLFAATESGQVLALDADTGEEVWRTSIGAPAVSPILSRRDILLVGDLKGTIHYLDPSSGEVLRRGSFGAGIYSLLPVVEDRFLVEGEDGRLGLFSLWRSGPHWERKGTGIADVHPVVQGSRVFKAEEKELLVLDAESGAVESRVGLPAPVVRGLRFGAGALYGRDTEGFWVAVEPRGGLLRWRSRLPSFEVGFEADHRRVWILGRDRNLYLFDEAAAQFSAMIGR